ncbi:UDP-N-acetylmuramate--L-alanine ligase [Carboxylicivirga mesophila]|uniref:UDP-N-acetylmuramate--L-alanine ligase n=1 Tax=Carboxylicivirga mesophila TaxID=1166478 RepID=A0ABS5KCH1_9BACT|nr:UDP-N-acetylmuramate--L-alanine ligase [Carboxylicivirga mesophila]MBS2212745.1 UDP-N-acetylmuramate--L-alanine ligase [Carboxylicivirga mesophila]
MLQLKDIKSVYFIGVGGIGMSAIARFFKYEGLHVAGYDRVSTVLTKELEAEGIDIHYEDDIKQVALNYHDKSSTLVVYTPAIPADHSELCYFNSKGFDVRKRAAVLGLISSGMNSVCVAGTHGKTTISSMTAHLYKQSSVGCNAFLGGIINNYKTNFLHDGQSPYVVLEADEFDRSFLHLHPHFALISAVDADHLDIYGDEESVSDAFHAFVEKIEPGGVLLHKAGLMIDDVNDEIEVFTYSIEEKADFSAMNIRLVNGMYQFDMRSPFGVVKGLEMGVPGLVNVENAVGAIGLALLGGVEPEEIKAALPLFEGIRRRFQYRIKEDKLVFIDDYAHHPQEINATVKSVRALYPDKHITTIFQPHLYTRTRDFASGFAEALDKCDRVLLMDIYPARELPIEGVNADMIRLLMHNKHVQLVGRDELFSVLTSEQNEVILTLGAGDIDKEVPLLEAKLREFISNY